MSTPQGLEMHLNMSILQRPLEHLDVSTSQHQDPQLHLDLSKKTEACAAPGLNYNTEASAAL
jgi:hypothetical protein